MGVGGDGQQAALAEQAPACRLRPAELDAPEVVAVDARHAVVVGEPLVDERVVGGQQIRHAPVVPDLAVEEERHLARHRLAQVRVELGERLRIGGHQRHVAQVQPLPSEVVDQRPRARVGQHSADLGAQHFRVAQFAAFGGVQQLVVRDAAPQEEGESRRQLQVADGVGLAGADVGRVGLAPEEEIRADQDAPQRHLDAGVEVAPGAARLVETEQHLDVAVCHRAPERAPRDARDDLGGAGNLVGHSRRTAGEDPLPAGRIASPGNVVGPAQLHAADARRDRLVAGVLVAGDAVVGPPHALQVRLLIDEAHGQRRRPGLGGEAHLLAVVRDVAEVAPRGVAVRVEYRAADRQRLDERAVQANLQRVRLEHAPDATVVGPQQEDLHDVLAVHREVVLDRQPAPRAERQVVADPLVLAQVLVDLEDLRGRLERGIAHRQPGDLARGGQVPLGQHRRDRQHVGDVVEAEARIVRRQQRSLVDVEREQVADGVGVLGPVQPVHGVAPAGVGTLGGGRVDAVGDPGGQPVVGGVVGPRPVGRRHRAGAELADDLFPDLGLMGVAPDAREVEALQRQSGGQGPVVVAADAVAPEHLAVLCRGIRRRNGLRGQRGGPGPGGEHADGCESKQATYGQVWSHGPSGSRARRDFSATSVE